MPHAVLDNSLIDVMINRQIDLDLRDIEGAHHTGGKRVQGLLISFDFSGIGNAVFAFSDLLIVGAGAFPDLVDLHALEPG